MKRLLLSVAFLIAFCTASSDLLAQADASRIQAASRVNEISLQVRQAWNRWEVSNAVDETTKPAPLPPAEVQSERLRRPTETPPAFDTDAALWIVGTTILALALLAAGALSYRHLDVTLNRTQRLQAANDRGKRCPACGRSAAYLICTNQHGYMCRACAGQVGSIPM